MVAIEDQVASIHRAILVRAGRTPARSLIRSSRERALDGSLVAFGRVGTESLEDLNLVSPEPKLDRRRIIQLTRPASFVKPVERVGRGNQPIIPTGDIGDVQVLIRQPGRIRVRPAHRDALRDFDSTGRVSLRGGVLQSGIIPGVIDHAKRDFAAAQNLCADRSVRRDGPQFVKREIFKMPVIVFGMKRERPDERLARDIPVTSDAVRVKPLIAIGCAIGFVDGRDFERPLPAIGHGVGEPQQLPSAAAVDPKIVRSPGLQIGIMDCVRIVGVHGPGEETDRSQCQRRQTPDGPSLGFL